jgi:hypothetical protein
MRRAGERIRGLDAIGLAERFPESAATIIAALGLKPVNPVNIVSARVTDELPEAEGFKKVPPIEMTTRLRCALAPLILVDEGLYMHARDEFNKRMN